MPYRRLMLPMCLALGLSACGGTKLVKHAPPLPVRETPLTSASDAQLGANLDFVIVRNGPGTWAKNADWDEYLFHLHNTSAAPLTIDSIGVTDSTNHDATTLADRKQLVKATKATAKRYRQSGIKVMAGRGGGTLVAVGVGTTVVGGVAAIATAPVVGSAMWSTGYAGAGAAGATAATAIFVAGPVLVGMGIARAVNNHKVGDRIETRATPLPASIDAGGTAQLDLFYPLSPSPQRVTIHYHDGLGAHSLDMDTNQALAGLHLPAPAVATTTAHAAN